MLALAYMCLHFNYFVANSLNNEQNTTQYSGYTPFLMRMRKCLRLYTPFKWWFVK